MSSHASDYASFFETLNQEDSIEKYMTFFDEDSRFEDPFQKVLGVEAIYKVFEHMYATLNEPRFVVDEVIESGLVAYLRWHFHFSLSANEKEQSFVGVSRIEFTATGVVRSHIDYWDAAYNVYEKIPLLGSLLRLIKRKLHA
jgi:ketosteroid isomerase-like protein